MKNFKLYLGASGLVSTYEVTSDPQYKIIIETISQLRHCTLTDPVLRQLLLHIFNSVYEDDSQLPERLKEVTPLADQIPNKIKIQQIRTELPCDADVVDFLTDAFPDLYLESARFREDDELWKKTFSGQQLEDKEPEEISINHRLVLLWFQAVSTQRILWHARFKV